MCVTGCFWFNNMFVFLDSSYFLWKKSLQGTFFLCICSFLGKKCKWLSRIYTILHNETCRMMKIVPCGGGHFLSPLQQKSVHFGWVPGVSEESPECWMQSWNTVLHDWLWGDLKGYPSGPAARLFGFAEDLVKVKTATRWQPELAIIGQTQHP